MSLARIIDLDVHEDARGRLLEVFRDGGPAAPLGRQVFLTTARPGCVKGNHYHARKTEWFVVLTGAVSLELADRSCGRRETLHLDAATPRAVGVPPQISHALRNDGTEEALVLVSVDEVFSPDDPDTFSHSLVPEAT